jgi:hypothetical protein
MDDSTSVMLAMSQGVTGQQSDGVAGQHCGVAIGIVIQQSSSKSSAGGLGKGSRDRARVVCPVILEAAHIS